MRCLLPVLFSSVCFCLAGCSGGKDTADPGADADADADTDSDSDADSDSDTDTDSDADTDADTDADVLADVRDEMVEDSEGCETLGGSVVDGAKEYFWGEYSESGGAWTGQEAIYYFANATWESHGGADCVVVWDMTATEIACSGCELGLSVSATMNTTDTTCPSGMTQGDETFSEEYAIDEAGDGTSTWHFAESGSEFGAGYWVDGAANYLSESSCAWF